MATLECCPYCHCTGLTPVEDGSGNPPTRFFCEGCDLELELHPKYAATEELKAQP